MGDHICEICGKIFKLKADLSRHLNKKNSCELSIDNNKSRDYRCEICGYTTSIKQHITRHKNKLKPCKKKADPVTNII